MLAVMMQRIRSRTATTVNHIINYCNITFSYSLYLSLARVNPSITKRQAIYVRLVERGGSFGRFEFSMVPSALLQYQYPSFES
jgi:hypothetical protein